MLKNVAIQLDFYLEHLLLNVFVFLHRLLLILIHVNHVIIEYKFSNLIDYRMHYLIGHKMNRDKLL